ncbi:FAD-dependent oxidoreductase [Nocardia sp. bgisy118]|uniref:FAD-dependent oxidoreductase n=1 Tax=Nocardia sp. bgisy118 TaxID=3413786 RepID=UPI003F49CE8E
MNKTTETRADNGIEYASFSGWIERPTDFAPPLEGEITADVVVVGSGHLGMATALRLAERGVDVALLESEFCGWGAASRNGRIPDQHPGR